MLISSQQLCQRYMFCVIHLEIANVLAHVARALLLEIIL